MNQQIRIALQSVMNDNSIRGVQCSMSEDQGIVEIWQAEFFAKEYLQEMIRKIKNVLFANKCELIESDAFFDRRGTFVAVVVVLAS